MKCFQFFQVGYKHLKMGIQKQNPQAYQEHSTDLLGFNGMIFQAAM